MRELRIKSFAPLCPVLNVQGFIVYLINIMRKIEEQMLDAIHGKRNWKCANTEVICSHFPHAAEPIDRVTVLLHGSPIAIINPDSVDVSDCGWQTPTTKSRLNAILHSLCNAGISQSNYEWYLADKEECKHMQSHSRHEIKRQN